MPVLVKKKVPPLGEKKQMKLKVSREKKILNMRIGDKKSMKTKSKLLGFVCVFRKINKSDKLLSRLIKEKKFSDKLCFFFPSETETSYLILNAK